MRAVSGDFAQHDADHAEQHVDEVVQDRDLEDAEQLRAGVVAGEAEVTVVRRDPGDEAEDADDHEDNADERGSRLDGYALGHSTQP